MSSFRDVYAIIHHVQEESIKKGSDSIVQLFEVPDEKADSDRGRKKKNKSGHHYFNYTLLDDTSDDFFWSKLQGFLQVAGPRLELQTVSFDSIGRFGLSNTGKPVCARCGPCWMEANAGEAAKSLRIPQFVFAGRQSSPSDQRVPAKHRLLNEVQDSTEAEGDAWGEEEAEDQLWEDEELQEDELELGEAVGEDGEPPPEEEELPLEQASFAPLSRTSNIPPAMWRRMPPRSSHQEPKGSVGLAAFHLFNRREADAARKGSVAAIASIPKANPAAKGRGSIGTAAIASIPRANPAAKGSVQSSSVVLPRGPANFLIRPARGAVQTSAVVPLHGARPAVPFGEGALRPPKRKASDPLPSEPKLLRERLSGASFGHVRPVSRSNCVQLTRARC